MASEIDHITLANVNHEALKYLMEQAGKHPEWIATVAFYKAVQVIEASFAYTGVGVSSEHSDRKFKLKRSSNRVYQYVFDHYRVLWEGATIARYLVDANGVYKRFADFLPPARVVSELVEHRLKEIEVNLVGGKPAMLSEAAVRSLQRV